MTGEAAGAALSPQQEHLWALRTQGDGGAYQAECEIALDGDLDAKRLWAALDAVVARHESLRMTFPRPAGTRRPLQRPAAGGAGWSPMEDVGGRIELLEPIRERLRRTPPDLDRGLVTRAALVRIGPSSHRLLLAAPALCADAASLAVVLGDLAAAYGTPGARPAAPLQQRAAALWAVELLESDEAEAGRSRWRRLLRPEHLDLPLPYGRTGEPRAFEPACLPVEWPGPAGALLTAWCALLARLSGRSEVAVAIVVDGRSYPELADVVGPLARHLPVVVGCSPDTPPSELARRLAAGLDEARAWQDCFDWQELAPAPDAAEPYVPAAFEMLDEVPARDAAGVRFALLRRSATADRFALKLACSVRAGRARVELHHDRGRFSAAEAGRLARHLCALLHSLEQAPEMPIGRHDLLGREERRRLLVERNDTRARRPDATVVDLFEAHAARRPDGPAARLGKRILSYRALDAASARLARLLCRLGVGPEVRVGVCAEPSLELLVAVLGVLRAGGAYVPLDTAAPADRLTAVLEDAGAALVLACGAATRRRPAVRARVVAVEPVSGRPDAGRRTPRPAPGHLAYVTFTSGSTGRPKGVAVEHRQLANYVGGVLRALDVDDGWRFAMVSTLATDLGNTTLFGSLCSGGCLEVVPAGEAFDAAALARRLREHPVDVLKIVPSHLAALAEGPELADILPRRRLVLGGERAAGELVATVRRTVPSCAVFNHYGPTETTVGVLTHRVSGDGPPPIGRPIANTRVYVLDGGLEPVPEGVVGELYVAGAGLARGYVGRPEQTAERFLPEPFWGVGERMYRTGDVVRWREGELEFVGRVDEQVKVRGYRVELGEVEGVLRGCEGVREAVVVKGERGLVGYVVLEGEDVEGVRGQCRRVLPEYMVPGVLVELGELPLTASGKVDRGALAGTPPPVLAGPLPRKGGGAMSPEEELVAGIWCEVLGVEGVGVDDDFFELGGDSLQATRVVGRVRRALGIELPLHELFERTTVAGMAAAAAARGAR